MVGPGSSHPPRRRVKACWHPGRTQACRQGGRGCGNRQGPCALSSPSARIQRGPESSPPHRHAADPGGAAAGAARAAVLQHGSCRLDDQAAAHVACSGRQWGSGARGWAAGLLWVVQSGQCRQASPIPSIPLPASSTPAWCATSGIKRRDDDHRAPAEPPPPPAGGAALVLSAQPCSKTGAAPGACCGDAWAAKSSRKAQRPARATLQPAKARAGLVGQRRAGCMVHSPLEDSVQAETTRLLCHASAAAICPPPRRHLHQLSCLQPLNLKVN